MALPRRKVPVGEMAEQRRRSRRSLAAMLVSEHQPSRLREPGCRAGTGMSGPGVPGKPLLGPVLPSMDRGTPALWLLCTLGQQLFPSSLSVCCISGALIMLCVWNRGMCCSSCGHELGLSSPGDQGWDSRCPQPSAAPRGLWLSAVELDRLGVPALGHRAVVLVILPNHTSISHVPV